MIDHRPARERGRTRLDWLDSQHTFSFGDYHDPERMGFRVLRVINEDRVEPGKGFGTHPHQDMEILSYVLEGALEHQDSLGTGSVIRAGEFQRMTAGTGVLHSEYNESRTDPVHFLQIWILPERRGLAPSYEQRAFRPDELEGRLRLIASSDGREGALTIHQAVGVYAARLAEGVEIEHRLATDRFAWIHVVRGAASLNGMQLEAGDGAAVSAERELSMHAGGPAEILLFDLP